MSDEELAELFGVEWPRGYRVRFNVAPSQLTPIVRGVGVGVGGVGDGGVVGVGREVVMGRWGFVPSWRRVGEGGKGRELGPVPINARSETAGSGRMFSGALRGRRCVVPATGFYEWQVVGGGSGVGGSGGGRVGAGRRLPKRPFHIGPKGGVGVLALAGVWAPALDSGDGVDTFAILTCGPNGVMRGIHDRMPVILPMGCVDRWLDPGLTDVGLIGEMLRPTDDDAIEAREVSTWVNSVSHDDARCLEPPEVDGLWG